MRVCYAVDMLRIQNTRMDCGYRHAAPVGYAMRKTVVRAPWIHAHAYAIQRQLRHQVPMIYLPLRICACIANV